MWYSSCARTHTKLSVQLALDLWKDAADIVGVGVTHFTLLFADAPALRPLRLFADEVIPMFR